MNNFLKQQQEELAVFENFMRVCEYPILKDSVQQQDPPSPDIFYQLNTGITIEFELTNSIDRQLAQTMNDKKILNKGGFCNNEPIEELVLQKNYKLKSGEYQLRADRIELLVYLGLMPVWPYYQTTIPKFLERNRSCWHFDRIWIFQDDLVNPRILWSHSKARESVREYVIL